MFLQNLKKYRFLILLLVIIITSIVIFFTFHKKNKIIPTSQEKKQEIVVPARPNNFITGADTFTQTIKLARIATLEHSEKDAKNYTKQALALWRDVVNEFINTPPPEFANSKTWTDNLAKTFELIQEAQVLSKKSRLDSLGNKLDETQEYLNNFYQKEKNKTFALLLEVKKVSEAKDVKTIKARLEKLKLAYTDIKNMSNDQEFLELCQNFEKILSEIDNSTKATYKRAQAKLMPAFIEIYKKY